MKCANQFEVNSKDGTLQLWYYQDMQHDWRVTLRPQDSMSLSE